MFVWATTQPLRYGGKHATRTGFDASDEDFTELYGTLASQDQKTIRKDILRLGLGANGSDVFWACTACHSVSMTCLY